MSTLPKAIAFDLGKVLVDFDYSIAVRRIAARGKVTPEELGHFLLTHSPLLFRYELGLVSSEAFFNEICAASGFCGDFEEFSQAFGDIFNPIEPMVQLHADLRKKGLPTYIFSNTNELAIRYIRRTYPFFSSFNGYILSYEHGVMKPDTGIYEVVERQCGYSGSDILYIDDRPENIAAGAARGWQVVLQESPEKTLGELRKQGLAAS
jgi:HAD superfamily hydrolase (TIGR01509 family)